MIRRPIGTSLLAIGLILGGWWAYTLLGVAALPSLQAPLVFVSVQLPGANAQTMANTVMAPLERHLGRIPGIRQMVGTASEVVQVSGESPQIDTHTSTINQLIESKAISDMPLGNRQTMNIMKLVAGAHFFNYQKILVRNIGIGIVKYLLQVI